MPGPPGEADPGIVAVDDAASSHATSTTTTHIIYVHLGAALCGHRGIVHGGLLATLMDELLAVQVWHEMGAAFTAQLSIDYRRPVRSNQVIRGRSWTASRDGRKIWVRAEVAKRGETLVEARALFVVPHDGIAKKTAVTSSSSSSSKQA
ncbi:HotDog domain-containing protein [Syncephalis pseudoplumigaleata]|uniref:HotDog domain-containing protein n=1 Tax=Syncephalis pseudoplumigaleata TaxID=1712513 RepID=A0A4P9Z2W5_9FUNG|nr:HotDog domain-containing protein [Syncephalis pseudoplumigaleata]|eukprot:RKP26854.1 HotDog domain-containing protein [Syncephalis pseudoplumigaleata]